MTSWHQPSDSSFLLAMLKDGKRHSTNEIIQASLAKRGVGLTVHSRAADLRARGHNILCQAGPHRNGRTTYFYRLATLREPLTSVHQEVAHDGVNSHADAGRGSRSAADAGAVPPSPLAAPALQLALELPHRWEPAA